MKTRRNAMRATALGLVAALVLSACGGGSNAAKGEASELNATETKWYDAAADEPAIRWYSSHTEEPMRQAVEAFSERYPGLKVEALRLTSGNLAVRYAQEQAAGAKTADVVSIGDTRFIRDGATKGWFQEFEKSSLPAAAEMDDKWFFPGGATVLTTPYGICYNTNTVKDVPKTWEDVLDKKYKGRIVFPNFRNASVYVWAGQVWSDTFGPEYLKELSDLDPVAADSMLPGLQSVANGQADIGLACPPATAADLIKSGAPLDVVLPDPVVAVPHELAMSANTKSPNTTKLLMNFLLSEEGQKVFVGEGASSPIGVDGSVPITDEFVSPDFDRYDDTYALMEQYF